MPAASRQRNGLLSELAAVTSSDWPSVVTVTAPSWSVRQRRAPASAREASALGWGWPKRLRQPTEMIACEGPNRCEESGGR